MLKIIKNIFFITSFIFFITFVIFFYLSEKNIILINKVRSLYLNENNIKLHDLPLLENDTENTITTGVGPGSTASCTSSTGDGLIYLTIKLSFGTYYHF